MHLEGRTGGVEVAGGVVHLLEVAPVQAQGAVVAVLLVQAAGGGVDHLRLLPFG
jgi:hypothetical protein